MIAMLEGWGILLGVAVMFGLAIRWGAPVVARLRNRERIAGARRGARPRSLATEVRGRPKIDSEDVVDPDRSENGSILDLSDDEIAEIAETVPF